MMDIKILEKARVKLQRKLPEIIQTLNSKKDLVDLEKRGILCEKMWFAETQTFTK